MMGHFISKKYVLFGLMVVVLCTVVPRSNFSGDHIHSVDEAATAVAANALLEGKVMYRDIVETRPPVIQYVYALLFSLFGKYSFGPPHLFLTGLIALEVFLIYYLARVLHSRGAGLLAAAIFSVMSFNHEGSDMLTFHNEWLVIIFTLLGVLFFVKGFVGHQKIYMPLSGLMFGLGVISKLQAIMDFFAAAFIFTVLINRHPRLCSHKSQLTLFFSGFAGLIFLFALHLFLSHSFSDFWEHVVNFNVRYCSVVPVLERVARAYLYPFMEGSIFYRNFIYFLPVLIYLASPSLRSAIERTREGEAGQFSSSLILVPWLAFSYAGTALSGRQFAHYYIHILPPFCIVSGAVFFCCVSRMRQYSSAVLSAVTHRMTAVALFPATFAILLFFYPLWNVFNSPQDFKAQWRFFPWLAPPLAAINVERIDRNQAFIRTVSYIRSASRPEDPIFVWGYLPEMYFRSGHPLAARFLFCHTLTGLMTWENIGPGVDTSSLIVQKDWERLISDLRRSKPKFIIDTSVGDWRFFKKYPPEKYPLLRDLLKSDYEFDRVFHDHGTPSFKVYRRAEVSGKPLIFGAPGLTGFWKFEDNARDSSPMSRFSLLYGTLPAEGVRGKALEFDGLHDFVDLGEGFATWGNGLTFACWAYPTAVKSWARFLELGNGAPEDNIIFAREGTSNDLVFAVNRGKTPVGSVIAKDAITLNKWQHFAVTLSPQGLATIYKNGVPIQSGRSALPAPVIRRRNYIGRSAWWQDDYYAGRIDEVYLFDRELTGEEIGDL